MDKIEYPVIILSSTLGMILMISSYDLIVFYLGLELQSLSLYILASFKRNEEKSTEAGLKYFVLSALASGLLLYGSSLIYGFTGSTNFEIISNNLNEANTQWRMMLSEYWKGLYQLESLINIQVFCPE